MTSFVALNFFGGGLPISDTIPQLTIRLQKKIYASLFLNLSMLFYPFLFVVKNFKLFFFF